MPGVIDQDIDVTDFLGQVLDIGWIAQVSGDKASFTPGRVDLIDDGWNRSRYPLVPGHEIVGKVVAAGSDVKTIQVGQRVGVGWQRSACLECNLCVAGHENLCRSQQATCMGNHGGLADRIRIDGRFAFALPDEIPSPIAAPLLCGGVTVFSPLRDELSRRRRRRRSRAHGDPHGPRARL